MTSLESCFKYQNKCKYLAVLDLLLHLPGSKSAGDNKKKARLMYAFLFQIFEAYSIQTSSTNGLKHPGAVHYGELAAEKGLFFQQKRRTYSCLIELGSDFLNDRPRAGSEQWDKYLPNCRSLPRCYKPNQACICEEL